MIVEWFECEEKKEKAISLNKLIRLNQRLEGLAVIPSCLESAIPEPETFPTAGGFQGAPDFVSAQWATKVHKRRKLIFGHFRVKQLDVTIT